MKRLINWWRHRNDPHLRLAGELRILADEAGEERMHVLADTLNGIATEVALGSSQNASDQATESEKLNRTINHKTTKTK